jgi:hypothetical protein
MPPATIAPPMLEYDDDHLFLMPTVLLHSTPSEGESTTIAFSGQKFDVG